MKRFGAIVLVLAVAALGARALSGESAVVQPIAFPHKAHLELKEQKLECKSCHEGVETRAAAGRPSTKRCLSCHTSEAKSVEEKKLQAYGESRAEIPWRRVWRLPADVFFPHRAHVAVAKIACADCHGAMAALQRPPEQPLRTVGMTRCIACHESWQWPKDTPAEIAARRIPTDCAACHR